MITSRHMAAGFFVMRTPALPFDAFFDDPRTPNERIEALLRDETFADALWLASPSLYQEISRAERPDPRAMGAVYRYASRMASRSTPFGLFAGCSLGRVGESTHLEVSPPSAWIRRVRLDYAALHALAATSAGIRGDAEGLCVWPNTTLYRVGTDWRYYEERDTGGERAYFLVSVADSEAIAAAIRAAQGGRSLARVADELARMEPDVRREDVEEFVRELLSAQLLVADRGVAITAPDPLAQLAAESGDLGPIRSILERCDRTPFLGTCRPRIEELGRAVAQMTGREVAPVQVDLMKPTAGLRLANDIAEEILRAATVLQRCVPRPGDPLEDFRSRFRERYGDGEVPLLEALDEEIGIGVGNVPDTPLLERIALTRRESAETQHALPPRVMAKALAALASGADEIELAPEDGEAERKVILPDAFAAFVTLFGAPDRVSSILLHGSGAAPGAQLLGRFCWADEELASAVAEHLRAEERLRPDAVFAEIVHIPEERHGNVASRPRLRSHEIAICARPGVDAAGRIALSDLRLSVQRERLVLRSASLDREVVPRLSVAHGYPNPRNIAAYRFLAMLQQETGGQSTVWNWGTLDVAPFLPRVACGRVVLSPARWRLQSKELAALRQAVRNGPQALRTLRESMRMPRFVIFDEGESGAPVDLDDVTAVRALLPSRIETLTICELLPRGERFAAEGTGGRFANEIVVPYIRTAAAPASRTPRPAPYVALQPGLSDWLYTKVYAGGAVADAVICAAAALPRHLFDRWHFVRYRDPEWHVRLRFRSRGGSRPELRDALDALFASFVAQNPAARIRYDTYEPEVTRYGGMDGIEIAEQLFSHDSDAAAAIVETVRSADRWPVVACGIDALLSDFGLDAAAKAEAAASMRDGFAAEFRIDRAARQQLAAGVRRHLRKTVALLDSWRSDEVLWARALRGRGEQVRRLVPGVRRVAEENGMALHELLGTYVHMHVNRVLRARHREQELVLHDLLQRAYTSAAARMAGVR